MTTTRTSLADTLAFFLATDRLKHEQRRNRVLDASRHETVAEHSWHVSLLALVVEPFAPDDVDVVHVRELLTVHDLVEVYAGDTWFYSGESADDITAREADAANRLVALLPEMLRPRFTSLLDEFAAQITWDARYARALDALHPMLLSYGPDSEGHPLDDLNGELVLTRKRGYLEPFPYLWEFAQELVASAIARGILKP